MRFLEIATLDRLLQTIRRIRSDELGQASTADVAEILETADTDGERLGALTIGALDASLTAEEADPGLLGTLLYALFVGEQGHGEHTVRRTKRTLVLLDDRSFRDYVKLGRMLAMRAFAGEPVPPGSYGQLLLCEIPKE